MAATIEALAALPGSRESRALRLARRRRGEITGLSLDVDPLLLGAGMTAKILGQIQDALEDGPLPFTFDLSILAQITQADILDHIRRVGVVFYEKKPLLA